MQGANKEKGRDRRRERIDVICVWAIIVLFVFVLLWSPLNFGGNVRGSFLAVLIAASLMLAIWIVRMWLQRPFRLLCPPVCWPVLAFMGLAILRYPSAAVEYTARQTLIHVLVYGAIFFIALNNLNRRNSATIVSLALVSLGFVLSLLGILQVARHSPQVWGVELLPQYAGRGTGTFMNPNHLAAFLGMTVPLALAYTMMSRLSVITKVFLGYAVIVMLAGIAFSVSRGGMVAAAIALLGFCAVLLTQRDYWKPTLGVLAVVMAGGIIAYFSFDSIEKRFHRMEAYEGRTDSREFYWAGAVKLFNQHKLLGIGPGHFDIKFPTVRTVNVQTRPVYCHNDYLNTLCDWGIVGMAIVAAFIGLLYWGAYRVWQDLGRTSRDTSSGLSDRRAFVLGASAGLLSLMIHCFVEFNMQVPGIATAAIALMALLAGQWRFATERFWMNPGKIGKVILPAAILSLIGFFAVQGMRQGRQVYWIYQSINDSSHPDLAAADAQKALDAEPMDWSAYREVASYLFDLSGAEGQNETERLTQSKNALLRAMELNPFDAYAPLGCGMALDRMGKLDEATPYFVKAVQLDPNLCYVDIQVGRHLIEFGELEAAKMWMYWGMRREPSPGMEAEFGKIHEDIVDPVYLAQAADTRATKAQKLEHDPDGLFLLKGPEGYKGE